MTPATSTFAPFRLTICGIPELDEHCATGVTHVLSILDPDWTDPPAFAAFPPHRRLALRFYDVIEPRPDQLAPAGTDRRRRAAGISSDVSLEHRVEHDAELAKPRDIRGVKQTIRAHLRARRRARGKCASSGV